MERQCYFCGSAVIGGNDFSQGGALIACRICGTYRLSERVAQYCQEEKFSPGLHPELSAPNLARISGAIREHHENAMRVTVRDVAELLSSVRPPTDPFEAIDRILLYVNRHASSADEYVSVDPVTHAPIAYARSENEMEYYLGISLEMGLIERKQPGRYQFRLTMSGWQHLSGLKSKAHKTWQAFVAMWFDDALWPAYEDGIKPALKLTGYEPVRVDREQFIGKIDDQIIADIRKSGLLVADFTGHRGGVYFEAGFAMGLGIPVIWTCRGSDIGTAHFDTRQYNHIVWTEPSDLFVQLKARIEALLPTRVPRP